LDSNIIAMLVITIFVVFIGFHIYTTYLTNDKMYTELSLEKQTVKTIRDSIQDMFYQPNGAITFIKIPENVMVSVYSKDNTTYIKTKNYYDAVPNVVLTQNVTITNTHTIVIKKISTDPNTGVITISINKA